MNATDEDAAMQGTNVDALMEAQRALEFARLHDWGRIATLRRDRHGDYSLVKIIDAYTLDGAYHEELVALPATMQACREFGGY